ncbi:MAG: metallophosphoesterase [Thermoplasmata archaeon]|nr:metallophosphoesterase [Thermoplasmata archaeon]
MTPGPSSAPRVSVRRFAPAEILEMDVAHVDLLLDRLEADVPVHPALVDLPAAPRREAVVFGDTHGDWWSTLAVAERFLAAPAERCLVGLGDYVDRAPDDCREGSVANALFLLELVAEFPDRVFLLQGNHEAARRIPAMPHDLPEEIDALWGPDRDRYARLMGLLERGPIAALSPSGAYLAHGGFPRGGTPATWRELFARPSDETLMDVLWTDSAMSRIHRGLGPPFTSADLAAFFDKCGARVFLRGHDPDITGRPAFDNRCLTLHTSRVYERYGGVIFARLPLATSVQSLDDVKIEHTETEGQSFPIPP